MIAFDLQCINGHIFEGWFEDSQAYEEQKEKSLIACPVCNNTSVSKIPSTFAIKSSSPSPPTENTMPDQTDDLRQITQKILEIVDKNFDDVGCDFAREALKMHYGVSKPRNIKGSSTREEEKTLKKEGIEFFKIPVPPPSDSDTDT